MRKLKLSPHKQQQLIQCYNARTLDGKIKYSWADLEAKFHISSPSILSYLKRNKVNPNR